MAELGEFVKHREGLKALDVEVLGISSDPVEKCRDVQTKLRTLFPILSDGELTAMETYGTRKPPAKPDEHPINVPTLVLIDRQGIIRWIHQAEDYRIRAPISEVLEAARKLQ